MITAADLSSIDIFAGLDRTQQQYFARKAADIRLEAGEMLVREGNISGFYVLLQGEMQLEKNILGVLRQLNRYSSGDYFGEVPILLGAPSLVSVRAETRCRVARFDRQQFQELIRDSAQSSAAILQTMNERIGLAQQAAKATPSARVVLKASRYDRHCHSIRAFLAANRIQYEWTHPDNEPERSPIGEDCPAPTVTIDGVRCIAAPSVREVAEALGLQTAPKQANYDVVIVGAGPTGLAAGVYGASEGLSVLMVERSAAGGQAGASSRIENYLGFPNGISGDELSERALSQASRFGAEIAMTRSILSIQQENNGYCLWLDGKERIFARAVLLANGVEWRRLDVPGLEGLLGRGVLYGASRTEAFGIVGKRIFLVGGGNSAGQAAMFFSDYAEQVRVLVRGPGLHVSMSQYLIDQLATKDRHLRGAVYAGERSGGSRSLRAYRHLYSAA